MKKLLLGTSALIGAAAIAGAAHAQEPLSVTVGGYLQFDGAHVSESDDNDTRSTDFRTSSEVHIRAEGTTDNGLTYGAHIELEADNGTNTDNGDENHIYVSGGWGKVELGDKDGAATVDGLQVVAPGDFGLGGVVADEESYRDFLQATAQTNSQVMLLQGLFEAPNAGKSTKITYYTPVWNGLQAGVSYSNDNVETGTDTTRDNIDASAAAYNLTQEDVVELAAKYATEYNNVGIALSLAYTMGDAFNTTAVGNDTNDLSAWAAGLQLTFGGFTLGGSYVNAGESFQQDITAAVNGSDTDGFTVGLQYETGPFVFGINHLNASTEGRQAVNQEADDDYDATSVGVSYAAAPGWVAYAEYTDFDYDGDDDTVATDDNEGNVFILGTRVSF